MQYIFPTLRKHQAKTLETIQQSTAKFIILHMPTGGGKSFFPAQLATWGNKVLSLVATKSLQAQYADNYSMELLYGKGNYDCLQQDSFGIEQPTADDCQLDKDNRQWCNQNCPYPSAKWQFLASNGGVLNYAKFLLDKKLVEDFDPEYLFLDEAHLLSDIVLGYAGLEFYWSSKELQKYSPGPFPTGLPQSIAYQMAIDWLRELLLNMNRSKPIPPWKNGKLYPYRWHKNRLRMVATTLDFMRTVPESWYIECDHKHLLIKPKTARFNFIELFDKAEKIILMSATLDSHMMRELGISNYEWIEVPNLWPKAMRPVHDLRCPKMGFKSSNDDWDVHARKIAVSLSQRPSEHTGLIHSPSKKLAFNLANRLKKLSNRRIFVPDIEMGTNQVYEEWNKIKDDGTIGIFWQAWEGWDCAKDSINIVAKTPFVNFSDGFDKARFMYDGKAGYSRVAAKFQQGLGRIRRGNAEDYGDNKLVAIADGNWTRVKKYFNDVNII